MRVVSLFLEPKVAQGEMAVAKAMEAAEDPDKVFMLSKQTRYTTNYGSNLHWSVFGSVGPCWDRQRMATVGCGGGGMSQPQSLG